MKKRIREVPKSRVPSDADKATEEPIGIVISRGGGGEVRSVFSAYIWGPAPEPQAEPVTRVA